MKKNSVKIGFAAIDMTPALAADRPVYGGVEARVFYLRSGRQQALYLICDAMDFTGLIVDALRDALRHATGIGAKHLHIVTTHNHGLGDNEGLSIIRLSALVAVGARRAMEAAKPARMAFIRVRTPEQWNFIRRFPFPAAGGKTTIFYGASPQDGYNLAPFLHGQELALAEGKLDYVRRAETDVPPIPAMEADDVVDVLKFDADDGQPLGVIVRYSTHVNCCNRPEHYTGDFPFFLRRILERELGGIAVFLTGPCAEISPGLRSKDEGAELRLSRQLADLVLDALRNGESKPLTSMRDGMIPCKLKVRPELINYNVSRPSSLPLPDDPAERKRELEARSFPDRYCDYLFAKWRSGEATGKTITGRVGVLRLNDLTLLALPGETFSACARELAADLPGRVVTVTEHDRTLLYLAPKAEIDAGGYESCCRIIHPGEAEAMMEKLRRILQE